MTKCVRFENADNNPDVKVVVHVYERGNGISGDSLIQTVELTYPTAMKEITFSQGRYAIVTEQKIIKEE